jgi:hypothetical protein
MTQLIIYTDNGKSQIQLRADLGMVWLTQLEMVELFDATKQNISLHLKNIIEGGELDANSVVKESLTTASDTKKYRTQIYNLDAILAVGYRVNSPRGVQFRRWFDEVLARIRHEPVVRRKWLQARGRFATRCVANSADPIARATTESSSVVGEARGGAL